jgi:hypothetical protein
MLTFVHKHLKAILSSLNIQNAKLFQFVFKAYFDYMVDVATFLGAEPNFARTDMLDVLQFEMQLANISLPREERRNATR